MSYNLEQLNELYATIYKKVEDKQLRKYSYVGEVSLLVTKLQGLINLKVDEDFNSTELYIHDRILSTISAIQSLVEKDRMEYDREFKRKMQEIKERGVSLQEVEQLTNKLTFLMAEYLEPEQFMSIAGKMQLLLSEVLAVKKSNLDLDFNS
jgi:hypothetical protein